MTPSRFDDKVVVVIGGATGIGRASAERFAREGATVVIGDINLDAASAVATELTGAGRTVSAVHVDVSDEAAVVALIDGVVDRSGRIDALHNNAAILAPDFLARDQSVLTFEDEVFQRSMNINVRGAAYAAKAVIPHMIAQGGGAIVNTVSLAGLLGTTRLPIYGMTKAALASLTRSIATQYGKEGIRCNAVAPGTIQTDANAVTSDHLLESRLAAVLTTRLGEPDDIASAIVFLASSDAAYITGQTLVADGGLSAHYG